MAYVKNTWNTDDIITADKLNNIEGGFSAFYVKQIPATDFAVIASQLGNYEGVYRNNEQFMLNAPEQGATWSLIRCINVPGGGGLINVDFFGSSISYVGYVNNGSVTWVKQNANNVVLLTGDQTVSGNKNFSGNVSIGGTPMNYSAIPTISITGYVSGNLQVRKQGGIVSFTSMDLVLTKGATFTLPAGYLPRNQLQAPITGQSASGTTAAGYLTVGADGLVTFNSLGFASGNATTYVNVNYVAQV